MPTLLIQETGAGVRRFEWTDGCVGIGTNAANQVVIAGPGVSAWHAAIYPSPGGTYRLRDLGGKGGTRVGGRKIQAKALEGRSSFDIGGSRLTFVSDDDSEEASETPVMVPDAEVGLSEETAVYKELPVTLGRTGLRGSGIDVGSVALGELYRSLYEIAMQKEGLSRTLDKLVDEICQFAKPSICMAGRLEGKQVKYGEFRKNRLPTRIPEEGEIVYSHSVVSRVIDSGKPCLVQQIKTDAELAAATSITRVKIVGAICVPLKLHRRVSGVVYADWRDPGPGPTTEEIEWIHALAILAGSAFENSLYQERLKTENEALRSKTSASAPLIGISEPLRVLLDEIDRCAPLDVDVLLLGESGTGKELVARRIHDLSRRRGGPFVAINCGAIPRDLIAARLFGHEKGAFTDAKEARMGVFEQANGGTLFLDEIGDMLPQHQVALLRVLERREVTPEGGTAPRPVDVRVLAATNRDVTKGIEKDELRPELLYRLEYPLPTPPLRDHPEDIPILAYHLLDRLTEEHGKNVTVIAPDVMDCLLRYPWPGNVRELRNCLLCAYVLCDGRIELGDLRKTPEVLGERPEHLPPLQEVERQHIIRVLKATRGNQKKASKILGVTENGLHGMMKRHEIDRGDFR